jgi:hypothetical protein
MVKVRFLQDFRGKLTSEIFYLSGTVAEFEAATAQALLDEKRVELAEVSEETSDKPKPRRKKATDNGVL